MTSRGFKKFKRYCTRCNLLFQPETPFNKICKECKEKMKNEKRN